MCAPTSHSSGSSSCIVGFASGCCCNCRACRIPQSHGDLHAGGWPGVCGDSKCMTCICSAKLIRLRSEFLAVPSCNMQRPTWHVYLSEHFYNVYTTKAKPASYLHALHHENRCNR